MTNIRLEYESASVKLFQVADATFAVSSLVSKTPGQGHGTKLMQNVVDYADAYGYTLTLSVQRFRYRGEQGLTNDQLVEFYKRFGFTQLGRSKPIFMLRPASQKTQG